MRLLLYRKIRQLVKNLNCRLSWSSQLESFTQWTVDGKDLVSASKRWSAIDLVLLYSTALQPIIVLLTPLDPFFRILLCDNTYCMGIAQYHNWICTLFCLNTLYFRWRMLHHHPLDLIQLIRVVRRGSVCSFFVHQHMPHKGSLCLVTRVILHYDQLWIIPVRQFYMVVGLCTVLFNFFTIIFLLFDFP